MEYNDRKQIEIYVSCRNLADRDIASRSDPIVKLIAIDSILKTQTEIGRTERILNNLNPDFIQTFQLYYIFETKQEVRFEVIDDDGFGKSDFLGYVQTTIGNLVGARFQTSILDLKQKDGTNKGTIILRALTCQQTKELYTLTFDGVNLKNVGGCCGKSSPFLRIQIQLSDGSFLTIFETECNKKNLNPIWKPIKSQLTNGYMLQKIQSFKHHIFITIFRIECWDFHANGYHKFMGSCETFLKEIKELEQQTFTLFDTQSEQIGTLNISNFSFKRIYNFLDYIRGGIQLNLILAVDYTSSNGDPQKPDSLHYHDQYKPLDYNYYQEAIISIGEILLSYDFDKMIPAYGFGAKPQGSMITSHCFPLSGEVLKPEVYGLEQVMQVYKSALQNMELNGPTYFGPIILQAMKVSKINKDQGSLAYNILLIITDGRIDDLDQTIQYLFQAALLPLSIIIVGIGNEDFSLMKILDGDDGLQNNLGQPIPRDIVQFVPFQECQNDPIELSQTVLAEIPGQVTEYYERMGMPPIEPEELKINEPSVNLSPRTQLPSTNPQVQTPPPYFGNPQQPEPIQDHVRENSFPYESQVQIFKNPFDQFLNEEEIVTLNSNQNFAHLPYSKCTHPSGQTRQKFD